MSKNKQKPEVKPEAPEDVVAPTEQVEAQPSEEQKPEVKPEAPVFYVVANGKAITSLKGVLGEKYVVTKEMFSSEDIFNNLVSKGYIVNGIA